MGEDRVFYLAIRNQTENEVVKIKGQTVVEKAVLTNFVFNSVPIQDRLEASKLSAEFVNQVHRDINLDTSSEFSSFAQNFCRKLSRRTSITRALQKIQQRYESVVMANIDDRVIATETIEDHLERIREVFECLNEAGSKMRAEKCDFMRTETKYLRRVVSAEGIKPDPAAVSKIQEWMPPRNKEELQSFLGFANYYRDFIPFHAAKVQPMQELLRKNQRFQWKEKHQEAFDSVKQALVDATALAAPNGEGRFVLDTDASAVAIAGILHQEQEYNRNTILRPIVHGSKTLTRTQLNYVSPKLEMYAGFYFIENFHSYLAGREFTLRVDNQALSWLKTYSMDKAKIGRWIARLDQYHFETIHRPRTQHRNVDGLSKRTNDYVHREKIVEALPEESKGFSFMSQKDYEDLPTVPYIDKHGKFIPKHPELPPETRAQLPVLYILKKRPKRIHSQNSL